MAGLDVFLNLVYTVGLNTKAEIILTSRRFIHVSAQHECANWNQTAIEIQPDGATKKGGKLPPEFRL